MSFAGDERLPNESAHAESRLEDPGGSLGGTACRPDLTSPTLLVSRADLEARYLYLMREVLPEQARAEGWPIRYDHCLMRVALDHVFEDAWYGHLKKRPAYRHLTDEQLAEAIRHAESMRDGGTPVVRVMNRQSLRWRGKQAAS
ncbi:MAG: hypothetical protein AAF809_09040 [Bacteroidota bacterium]